MFRKSFTFVEALTIMGILSILGVIAIIAINPRQSSIKAHDAERLYNAQQIEKAAYRYLIEQNEMAGGDAILEGEANAKPICRSGVSGTDCASVAGVTMSDLVTEYIALLPVDPLEPYESYTGYSVYEGDGIAQVRAVHLGELPGDAVSGGCSSASSSSSSEPSSSSSSSPDSLLCNGLAATVYVNVSNVIVGGPDDGQFYAGTLNGGNGSDVIVGTSSADIIDGGNGGDTICGRGGDDSISGGGDNGGDIVFGEEGDDMANGYNGKDTLCGGNGDDNLIGENGVDSIDGGGGTDTLDGGESVDICVHGESLTDCEDTTTEIAECGE